MIKLKIKVYTYTTSVVFSTKVDELFINIKNEHVKEGRSCKYVKYNDVLKVNCNINFFLSQIKETLSINEDDGIILSYDTPNFGNGKIYNYVCVSVPQKSYDYWVRRRKRVGIINEILDEK